MCIRDRYERGLLPGFDDLRPLGFRTRIGHLHNDIAFVLGIVARDFDVDALGPLRHRHRIADLVAERHAVLPCLLYTSDAADEL